MGTPALTFHHAEMPARRKRMPLDLEMLLWGTRWCCQEAPESLVFNQVTCKGRRARATQSSAQAIERPRNAEHSQGRRPPPRPPRSAAGEVPATPSSQRTRRAAAGSSASPAGGEPSPYTTLTLRVSHGEPTPWDGHGDHAAESCAATHPVGTRAAHPAMPAAGFLEHLMIRSRTEGEGRCRPAMGTWAANPETHQENAD